MSKFKVGDRLVESSLKALIYDPSISDSDFSCEVVKVKQKGYKIRFIFDGSVGWHPKSAIEEQFRKLSKLELVLK